AERGPLLLADNGQHRLMVELGVVQAVQQVNRTWPRRRQADADFAGELRMRASHECGQFLVPRLHEADAVAGPVESADDAVDAVSGIAVDPVHAPFGQALQQKIAYGCSHLDSVASVKGTEGANVV